MTEVVIIETKGLGDRSYLVHDGEVGVVIDPQRDIDRMLDAAREAEVRITHVAETHVHNDYVSGGLQLARVTAADYLVNAADVVDFDRRPVTPGDQIEAGRLRIGVIATPGHTPNHLAYTVSPMGGPGAVFTGGSMLFGSVGRTDLAGPEMAGQLTRAQWASVRRLAAELAPEVEVFPTHGFGSFCSSAKTSGSSSSTIAQERSQNVACTTEDQAQFVATLLSGLTAYPAYYAHMDPINRGGPAPLDLTPLREVDAAEVHRRIDAGEWVVDLRLRRAFARGHLVGSVGVELNDNFATYLGWVIPWGTPVTLVGGGGEEIARAQRELGRIGIDGITGASADAIDALAQERRLGAYPAIDFAQAATALRDGHGDAVVLDVRRDDERARARVLGSVHIPLHALEQRMDEVPHRPLLVHCASGFRASIAASLLDRAGRDVVLIDDEFANAAAAGMPLE